MTYVIVAMGKNESKKENIVDDKSRHLLLWMLFFGKVLCKTKCKLKIDLIRKYFELQNYTNKPSQTIS
jgi:hypothetical protein